ncbi:hypothetical protein, partial [Mesorhizobium sp. M7A.F.Ca.CA.001.08.1.1]|uniref:hypothetical protein n=1 Tax=Mesorhizobium sp. M7A.F.Ca.CA.001.08.1.1 TaxID=2496691 RepID=UPI001FDF1291
MEKAAPFDRPFFQKFYGIHDATDLFENETVISHENRLFERSALHLDLPSSPKAALVSLRVTQDDSSANMPVCVTPSAQRGYWKCLFSVQERIGRP